MTGTGPALVRFRKHVGAAQQSQHCHTSCQPWSGATDADGYGIFRDETGHTVQAHGWLYRQKKGPVPAGMQLRHICGTPECVRLSHLVPGTAQENYEDSIRHGTRLRRPGLRDLDGLDRRDVEYIWHNSGLHPSWYLAYQLGIDKETVEVVQVREKFLGMENPWGTALRKPEHRQWMPGWVPPEVVTKVLPQPFEVQMKRMQEQFQVLRQRRTRPDQPEPTRPTDTLTTLQPSRS